MCKAYDLNAKNKQKDINNSKDKNIIKTYYDHDS